MDLETLNLYLDGLLSLVLEHKAEFQERDLRALLIEESAQALSFSDLVYEWLSLHSLSEEEALKMKIWFALPYKDLAEILSISTREVGQLLRTQRSLLLPNRVLRDEQQQSPPQIGGLSCFMIEQHLSVWIDGEIQDATTEESLRGHLKQCRECRGRLEEYRTLQEKLLSQRQSFPSIAEEEWSNVLRMAKVRRRQRIAKSSAYFLVVCVLCFLIVWVFWSKAAKTPNIYDIQE